MNNGFDLFSMFKGFMRDPTFILAKRNLTANALQNPREAVQQLLNNGQLTQQQLNSMQQFANGIIQNPMFRNLIGR